MRFRRQIKAEPGTEEFALMASRREMAILAQALNYWVIEHMCVGKPCETCDLGAAMEREIVSVMEKKPYRVVTAQTVPQLEALVAELIADGYMPASGVSVSVAPLIIYQNNNTVYAQAMVLVEACLGAIVPAAKQYV